MADDHYDALGVPRDADAAAIKRAHRQAVQKWHPDKPGGDEDKFKAVQAAYDTLGDDQKRAHYDRTGGETGPVRSELAEIAPYVIGAFDKVLSEVGQQYTRTAVIDRMVAALQRDIASGNNANLQQARGKAEIEKMRKRLGFTGEPGKNLIDSTLAQRLRDADEMMEANSKTIGLLERAVEHVQLYGWEVDPEPVNPFAGYDNAAFEDIVRDAARRGNFFTAGQGGQNKAPPYIEYEDDKS